MNLTHTKIKEEKNDDQDEKTNEQITGRIYKLKNDAVCSKTMRSLRNRIDAMLLSNEKGYLKWTSKKIKEEKNDDQDEKANEQITGRIYKLMNYAVCSKTMISLRNRIDAMHSSNEKGYLKWTSKPSYMSQNTFARNLVAIPKSTVIFTLNKPAYAEMCI